MGTLKDTINAASVADAWCTRGAGIIATRSDDPATWYGVCDTATGFMQILSLSNPPKFKAMFLQSLLELAGDMPAGEEKTRLTAIGNEDASPTLAAQRTWYAANKDGANECRNMVDWAAAVLDGSGDSITPYNALFVFARARAEVDGAGVGIREADAALLTLWKSRCTLTEWANGLT